MDIDKTKITKGPVEVGQHPAIEVGRIVKPILFGNRARSLPACEGGHILVLNADDALLIADAFNTFTATGLTPSELAEQRGELIEILNDVRGEYWCHCGHPACNRCKHTKAADAALTKAKETQ